jgi:hypothetical protein
LTTILAFRALKPVNFSIAANFQQFAFLRLLKRSVTIASVNATRFHQSYLHLVRDSRGLMMGHFGTVSRCRQFAFPRPLKRFLSTVSVDVRRLPR